MVWLGCASLAAHVVPQGRLPVGGALVNCVYTIIQRCATEGVPPKFLWIGQGTLYIHPCCTNGQQINMPSVGTVFSEIYPHKGTNLNPPPPLNARMGFQQSPAIVGYLSAGGELIHVYTMQRGLRGRGLLV